MAGKKVNVVRDLKAPTKPGNHFRLICMTGKNKGLAYFLEAPRIIIGRGESADIQVLDVKSSREHAELAKVGVGYVATDLGSQNGIVVNDLKVTQHKLEDGDKLIIGQTVFRYNEYRIAGLDMVEVNDDADEDDEEEVEETPAAQSKKNRTRMMVYAVVLALGAFMFLGDDSETNKNRTSKIRSSSDLDDESDTFSAMLRKKQREEDKDIEDKLSAIIHRGQREFREGNYFRAMAEFNMALVMSPKHPQASFYLRKTKQKLDEEIEENFLKAKRETEALQYRKAAVSYCSVVRLIGGYKDDARYKSAMDKIAELEEKLGLNKGEIKCIEE